MSFLYADGDKLALAKDVTNPNLIQQSDRFFINGSKPLGNFKMGQSVKSNIDNNRYAGLWTPSGQENWGIYNGDSTYIQLLSQTTYTFTAWIKCDGILKNSPWGWYQNISKAVKKKIMFSTMPLGNNEYKFYSTFTTPTTDPSYVICYLSIDSFFDTSKSFNFCFERMKLELGTESTAWIPAPEELVTKSDLDDIKAQIEQLKSK